MAEFFKWWNYPSMYKMMIAGIVAVILCFLCGYFIPRPWFLIPISIICIIFGIIGKRLFPTLFDDIIKEFKRIMGEGNE